MKTNSYRESLTIHYYECVGNPEGSPCDPVTTEPKGKAQKFCAIRWPLSHIFMEVSSYGGI